MASRGARALLFVALLAPALTGCIKKSLPPGKDLVADVQVVGSSAIDGSSIEERLATRPPPFPRAFEGLLYDYAVFDETVLARDLERVERYYRAKGFYEAKVRAARIHRVDALHVKVDILVHEGPEVRVGRSDIGGLATLPHEVAADALRTLTLDPGDRFDEDEFEKNAQRIAEVLGDAGYAFAKVKHHAKVDLVTHTADVSFEVEPGPVARYGRVRIVGLETIPEAPVRAVLGIEEGQRYSRRELVDAQEELQSLGIFASVEVAQDKSHPDTGEVPITVLVRPSSLRTLRMGGGARFDVLRLSNHFRIGWEHRNFIGGMRRFTVEARPGVTYFPTRIGRFETSPSSAGELCPHRAPATVVHRRCRPRLSSPGTTAPAALSPTRRSRPEPRAHHRLPRAWAPPPGSSALAIGSTLAAFVQLASELPVHLPGRRRTASTPCACRVPRALRRSSTCDDRIEPSRHLLLELVPGRRLRLRRHQSDLRPGRAPGFLPAAQGDAGDEITTASCS
ncbi:MAG: POTRA domain-containing protein [Polyangiaceae bacterium]